MSLKSYEAIYDHGQMKWLGDKPQVEEARVIVTILSGPSTIAISVKHQPSTRIAGKGKIIGVQARVDRDPDSPAADLTAESVARGNAPAVEGSQ